MMLAPIHKNAELEESLFAYRTSRNSQFRFGWHFHEHYELTLIVHSQGVRFVGDNISQYRDGDLVLLGPRMPHTWQSDSFKKRTLWNTARVIHFREDFLGERFIENAELRHVRNMLRRSTRGLYFPSAVRSKAAARIIALAGMSGIRRLTAFLELLDLLARSRNTTTISGPSFVPSLDLSNQRRIDLVCQYINENYTRNISQPDVLQLVDMGAAAFSSFFKKTVGSTFVQYINELRISHACRLLVESDLSVLEISLRSGFNNLSNFNRRFLHMKKMSPRQYRSMYTSSDAHE